MELPPPLRHAVEAALDGIALADLAATAAALSRRYRDERHDGRQRVASRREALAYLAVRLPATYAAVRASLGALAAARPNYAPTSALDVGAGPGTAAWAAADCWPELADVLLVEANPVLRDCGEALAAATGRPRMTWRIADVTAAAIDSPPRDLVTAAYLMNELAPDARPAALQKLWRLTADTLVIVEPGTPAGWRRILDARRLLVADGAHVIAPCAHARTCPLEPPDWCHFAQRVARSRLHRQAKGAEVPWEDEKFSYVALSREPALNAAVRIIAPPRKASGRVTLKLCRPDGSAADRLLSRRDGALYKRAARSGWGDAL